MSNSNHTSENGNLTLKKQHLLFCFSTLQAHLSKESKPDSAALPSSDELYPLFVTWNTVSTSGQTRLRGCIGTFEALPLGQGLQEYAIIAAVRDRRFNPITLAELPKLECAISLLTQFEECSNYLDWEIGIHGIYIDFVPESSSSATTPQANGNAHRRAYTATYLPEVASSQGWTKIEAIDSAIEKSGFHGPINEALRKSLHVRRYQSEKSSIRFTEWKQQHQQ